MGGGRWSDGLSGSQSLTMGKGWGSEGQSVAPLLYTHPSGIVMSKGGQKAKRGQAEPTRAASAGRTSCSRKSAYSPVIASYSKLRCLRCSEETGTVCEPECRGARIAITA